MKDYFRHYGNIAIIDIAFKSYRLTLDVCNEINKELTNLGLKPDTLEWYNKRYVITQERLRKLSGY